MASNTTNLNLTKPDITDNIQETIPALANNFEVIDTQLANTSQEVNKAQFALSASRPYSALNNLTLSNAEITSNIFFANKLNMPVSPYGNDEYVHPNTVFVPNGWNGYKYWMAVTPYKNQSALTENPCVYASNDLLNWVEPNGLTNPLQPFPGGTGAIHYSDTAIFLSNDGKTMNVVYRWNNTIEENRFYLQQSEDGVNWSEKVLIYQTTNRHIVSPEVISVNDKYFMYFIDDTNGGLLKRIESYDLFNWSNEVNCSLVNNVYRLWHIDVLQYGGGLILCGVTTDFKRLVLLKSNNYLSFSKLSDNFLTDVVAGRILYKPDLQLYTQDGKKYIHLIYNLMGDTQEGGNDYLLYRTLYPLNTDEFVNLFTPTLYYMNTGATSNEGVIPLSRTEGKYVKSGRTVTYFFRFDIGDITNIPSGRLIRLNVPAPPNNSTSFTCFIDTFGNPTGFKNAYGFLHSNGFMYIKSTRTDTITDTNIRTESLQTGLSFQGSITYFT